MTVTPNPVPARLRGEAMQTTPGEAGRERPYVKGTAPSMTPDLEEIIRRVQQRLPHVKWQQLPVTLPADDDGLWFFWLPEFPGSVQIESSFGECPFIVESDKHNERLTASTPDDTADTIVRWLGLPGG